MKLRKKKVLTNGYTYSQKQRREKLLGHLKDSDGTVKKKRSMFDANAFICTKCGRSNYDHPSLTIGPFTTKPYCNDLCPFVTIGE